MILVHLLARARTLSTRSADYDRAAALYRVCRRHGDTVRKTIDCLIAAVAIGHDTPVLHTDGDFDAMARHTRLAVHVLGG